MPIKKLFHFYIKTSIHIGFAVLSLLQISKYYLAVQIDTSLKIFVFFATVLGYNFLKYIEVFYQKTFSIKQNLDIIIVSFIAFVMTIYSFWGLNYPIQIAILKIGFVIFLYPFLRKFGIFKMFFVSFCLTYITVYIPCFRLNLLPLNFHIQLIQRFLIIICFLIPFEILDSTIDQKSIKTIPILYGIKTTKQLGYLLLIVFLSLDFATFNIRPFFTNCIIATTAGLYIGYANTNKNEYYTSFWVESLPIFWLTICFINR